MNATHTPGPWTLGPETSDEDAQIIGAGGSHIGYVAREDGDLVTAAPDLLEALRAVCAYYVDVNSPFLDEDERRAVELADAAIAKAEGRAV